MSYIAVLDTDTPSYGMVSHFEPHVDVLAGESAAMPPRTPETAQRLAALGEMTGGIVHDFRNILAVIGSALKMAEMSLEQPECARTCLAGAREGIDRGLKLTSELLKFAASREQGEVRGVGGGFYDVNILLKKFEPLLRYGAGPGVRVVLELEPDVPKYVIDPSSFESALLNLIVNARDAMADGGEIRISTARCSEVATSRSPESRSYVRVRVKDKGRGMTSEVLQKMFDPFFTTKGAEGTGLGLPQVREFMRKVRGHISVTSEQGIGTSVDLFFPLIGPGESAPACLREAELRPVVRQ